MDEIPYEEMGRRIAARREAMRLTLDEIAQAINMNIDRYESIENGSVKASVSEAAQITQYLLVSLDYIVNGTESADAPSFDPIYAKTLIELSKMSDEERQGIIAYTQSVLEQRKTNKSVVRLNHVRHIRRTKRDR